MHQLLDRHSRSLLDAPIPMLDNRSPRAAARTAKGRERIVAWLKTLENHSAAAGPDNPMSAYDFGGLWAELGVSAHRR